MPTLVVPALEDRNLPIEATGRRLPTLIGDVPYRENEGGPHNSSWTHDDEANHALLDVLGR